MDLHGMHQISVLSLFMKLHHNPSLRNIEAAKALWRPKKMERCSGGKRQNPINFFFNTYIVAICANAIRASDFTTFRNGKPTSPINQSPQKQKPLFEDLKISRSKQTRTHLQWSKILKKCKLCGSCSIDYDQLGSTSKAGLDIFSNFSKQRGLKWSREENFFLGTCLEIVAWKSKHVHFH